MVYRPNWESTGTFFAVTMFCSRKIHTNPVSMENSRSNRFGKRNGCADHNRRRPDKRPLGGNNLILRAISPSPAAAASPERTVVSLVPHRSDSCSGRR